MAALKSPEFKHPPLAEVALGVRYEPLPGFATAYVGAFWDLLRDRFPKIEEQAPLEMPIEQPPGAKGQPSIQVEVLSKPRPPRSWLMNPTGTEMIQIQPDFFAHNWRNVEGDDPYPRYVHIREQFESDYEMLSEFARIQKLGELQPLQCELTYVNHIDAERGEDPSSTIGAVIRPWSVDYRGLAGTELEGMEFGIRHLIRDQDGEFVGRLHVTAQSAARRRDSKHVLVLSLTARGRPMGDGCDGVLRFLDRGHDAIVHGFVELITDEMLERWGYTNS